MEKYLDTMRQTVELAQTCLDGINHLQLKLNDDNLPSTLYLMEDIVNAFYQIERAIVTFSKGLPNNNLYDLTKVVRETIEAIVSGYENMDKDHILHTLTDGLIPAFRDWKHELEAYVYPFIVS